MREPLNWLKYGTAVVLAAATVTVYLFFFNRLPIEGTSLALDWSGLWRAFQHWPPLYGQSSGMLIAPWDALLISPLGLLTFRASWGALSIITVAVMVVSVPQSPNRGRRWLATALLCLSYPSLRHLADGNFEALTILGVVLIVQNFERRRLWQLGIGLLLATAKEQETWLLMLTLGYIMLRYWPRQDWLKLGAGLALVVLPCLAWLGRDWVIGAMQQAENGSIMDSSLWAAINRLGLPMWLAATAAIILAGIALAVVLRSGLGLSNDKAAMLMALSLVLAPYASGNSFLAVTAIGIIPIFLAQPLLGLALMALTNLPFLLPQPIIFTYSAWYWTAMLLLVFSLCAWRVWRASAAAPVPVAAG